VSLSYTGEQTWRQKVHHPQEAHARSRLPPERETGTDSIKLVIGSLQNAHVFRVMSAR
jgi:hypothetical protein